MANTNSLGGVYKFGTLSVTAGDTVFTGTNTLWTQAAEQGDWILADGQVAIITADITNTELNAESPWTGDTLVDAPYVLVKMSWLRYEPAILQQKVRELLASLAASGQFLFVEGDEPLITEGDNGQWALKVNDGMWRLWFKEDDAWVYQGTPVGFEILGDYDPSRTYVINNGVGWQGKVYVSRVAGNVGNQPDTHPAQWYLAISNGDRYDITFFDTDRPASGELVDKKYPTGATFYSGLAQSYATAEIPSTALCYYSLQKNGTQFALVAFYPGDPIGRWTCPSNVSFAFGDKFTLVAPNPRDLTLSGVGGNIVAYR